MELIIREMVESDIVDFPIEFEKQGWNKPQKQYQRYFNEQQLGIRKMYIATVDNHVAGYATLLQNDNEGPFKDQNIPVIKDFNVLKKYQRNGIGTAILDAIEEDVKKYSSSICLGVGMHRDYGAAQRLYIQRGYIPDGSGLWFENKNLEPYAPCMNDDSLTLYLLKEF